MAAKFAKAIKNHHEIWYIKSLSLMSCEMLIGNIIYIMDIVVTVLRIQMAARNINGHHVN